MSLAMFTDEADELMARACRVVALRIYLDPHGDPVTYVKDDELYIDQWKLRTDVQATALQLRNAERRWTVDLSEATDTAVRESVAEYVHDLITNLSTTP